MGDHHLFDFFIGDATFNITFLHFILRITLFTSEAFV